MPPVNVVVSLDGSARAERALSCAQALSRHLGGELILVGSAPHDEDYDEIASYLDSVLPDEASQRFVPPRMTQARAVDTMARRWTPSIVCIASRGRSGREAAVLGSVPGELLTRGAAPLLVVGPAVDWSAATTCDSLIVCIDEPFGSLPALEEAALLAALLDLPLHVVTVVGVPTEAEESIARTLARLEAADVDPTSVEALVDDDATQALLRRASNPGTMLVITALGLSRSQRLAHGSVALDVIRRSKSPVLAVPPHRPPRGWRD